MVIIPAIDLIDGKCVRLVRGDYAQKTVYHTDPVCVAKGYQEAGLTHLHLVDLDGAKSRRPHNLQVVREITKATTMKVDFGGGIKSARSLQSAFAAGAHQVCVGSLAAGSPDVFGSWLTEYDPRKFILCVDVLDGQVMVQGWQKPSGLSWKDLLGTFVPQGVRHVLCTDISRDGMLSGPSYKLYQTIQKAYPDVTLIASGGIRSLEDLRKLSAMGLGGAVLGKAIYENVISIRDLSRFDSAGTYRKTLASS